jgi:hypothetical protein
MLQTLKIVAIMIFMPSLPSFAQQSFRPILPLEMSWKMPPVPKDLADTKESAKEGKPSKNPSTAFRESLARLGKSLRPSEQVKELATLRQAANRISPEAKIFAELTAARITGGLSSTGAKAGKATGNWRQHLLSACNTASKVDDATHEAVARQAVTIWRRIEGVNAPWSSPPIDIKAQKQSELSKSIAERQAIYDWQKGNESGSFKRYRSLAAAFNGSPTGAAIDLRLIDMSRSAYRKDKNVRRWQTTLISAAEKYQDKQFLGADNEARAEQTLETIKRIHKDLIDNLIKDASSRKASLAQRKDALAAIDKYRETNIEEREKQRVTLAAGDIQFLGNNHKAAANIYAGVATDLTGDQSINIWKKAIRSQTIVADWPTAVPWTNPPKSATEARVVLAGMFKKIDRGTATDWETAAHIGLLDIANGAPNEAMTLWTDRLQKFPSGAHASRAAGWITETHITAKSWTELESLGRLLTKANLTAISGRKISRPKDILGLALLEGGSQAKENGDFKTAILKLDEYVKGWRGDGRHDQGFYNLAVSYHGDKQFRNSITTMVAFTKMHKKSKFRAEALTQGGSWSLALTWEDHVMYFLETHALEFPKDSQTIMSLQSLTDLYMGRAIYDSAIRTMTILVGRVDLDEGSRQDVARRLLDTSVRHGAHESTIRAADKISASFKNDPIITAIALSVKARIYHEQQKTKALEGVKINVSKLDQSAVGVAEVISEISFLLAESLAANRFKESVFSLGTRDPLSELERGYKEFKDLDQQYRSACLTMRTGWCAPALHRTARLGERFLAAYSELEIAKTLAPEEVTTFQNRKKSIIESVEKQIIETDEKALELANSGSTNPEWTTAILWQNGGDWSHPRFTEESMGHFIQWQAR